MTTQLALTRTRGWVEVAPGSGMPDGLTPDTPVQVLLQVERDAGCFYPETVPAQAIDWLHEGSPDEVVAYRLAPTQERIAVVRE